MQNAALNKYRIPRVIVSRYIVTNRIYKSILGRKPVHTPDGEKDISTWIFRPVDANCPIMSKIIKLCVLKFCKEN